MRFGSWLVALAVLAAAIPRSVHASPQDDSDLARARALEASLEYDQALAIVDGLLARGGADPARYVELHLLAGRLAGGLDKPDLAREHFARVLALRPDTTLPDGTSPKIAIPFAAVKAHAQPLAVTASIRDRVLSIEARDALGIVKGVSVRVTRRGDSRAPTDSRAPDSPSGSFEVVERSSLRVALPSDVTVIEVAALDAAGNRVWIGPPPTASANGPNPSSGPGARSKPIYARWSSYAIIGGAALAFGGVAAWRFQVAQDDWNTLHDQGGHDFSQLQALEDRGRRWSTIANVSFGVAAAATVTSIIVGVVGRDAHGDRNVVVAPTANGIALGGHF